MCLMQTDLPVPEGPRIIVIMPSGMPRLRPSSTVLRPKRLTTSMNSTVSSRPWSRIVPWYANFSSSVGVLADALPEVDLFSGLSCPLRPLGRFSTALAYL